jgi:hypothetical protein
MSLERMILDAVRAALLLGLALASMPLLARAPAAARRLVLALALGGALVVPVVSALVPAWHVATPPALISLREPFREPLAEGSDSPLPLPLPLPTSGTWSGSGSGSGSGSENPARLRAGGTKPTPA